MGTTLLILGVALWAGAHLFKRLAPAQRTAMGEKGKGAVALALLGAIVLMVIGYRMADPVWLWVSPPWMTHVNNLLVFIAFYLFAVSALQTGLHQRIRHPQLSGFKAWAVAHLLVVGTLQGVILFGGLLAWAVVSVILINRANRDWTRPQDSAMWKEGVAIVGALFAMLVVGQIHGWLGPWPFGG
ncbi:NnrU family protein [Roseinatronobacter alkalisoli]|uniref:NnrU family protein n=1 Tax=Roseinatronobacter alkalisoli TaxID=3028235 RepID=A0ABT5T7C9_9RHOB|nr:NnrU family protein [Roseinatronobacter sp. HJB301]MDD7970291.1 NnrU family protein [Roseinatronobacter sp. HJB301]